MSENEKQWYVDLQNEITGPVTLEVLRNWFRVGTITSATWVRLEGQSEWCTLAMVEELDTTEDGIEHLGELSDQLEVGMPLHYLRSQELDALVAERSEKDRLLNRVFGIKCLAVLFVIIGCFYSCIFASNISNHFGWVFLLAWGLLCIPLFVLYYIFNSISISLNAIAKLMDRLEQRNESSKSDRTER